MEPILAIDIGGGTQDILLFQTDRPLENCLKLVLPSPTVIVAAKITEATGQGRDLYLHGSLMGGGSCVEALSRHLRRGLAVYAQPRAAKTIRDDLTRVEQMGVRLVDRQPPGTIAVRTSDVNITELEQAMSLFGVRLPSRRVFAVQDHGESPGESNRLFRFRLWERFVLAGGDINNLLYRDIPPYLTRMLAVQQDAPGAAVMDTGAAAIWGAQEDPRVAEQRQQGIVIVNVGNQHAIGVLFRDRRVWGLFEHHTSLIDRHKLVRLIESLQMGTLTHQEVFEDEGHGCVIHPEFRSGSGYGLVSVTGPRRGMLEGTGYYFAAPGGDMMLAGCYGMVSAIKACEAAQLAQNG
ncbi:MAG: DUF1786 domain-containing protein [Bacillota bacterium]